MLLNLWNYFKGYVIIEVSGFSIERFVNLAVHRGIYIWDIRYSGNTVIMKVSIEGFKMLKVCSRKTKCKIKIIDKVGRPFLFFKYRKRKIFFAGILFFISVLYILSSFIWLIEINGCDRIKQDDLLKCIENNGLKVGSFKHNVDKKSLEQKIVQSFTDISFINIEIKGTRAKINITEILPKQDIIDRTTPTEIIATKDGLIENIFISAGTPMVKPGDVVEKGDVLVSGELINNNEDGTTVINKYVYSIADIRAKVYYNINFFVDKNYIEKLYNNNIKKDISFKFLGKDLNIFRKKIKFINYSKYVSLKQFSIGKNYPLPIILAINTYKEFEPINKTRTENEMKILANEIITSRIIREFDFDADIIDKKINYNTTSNGIKVNCTITTLENIGNTVPMAQEKIINENTEDTLDSKETELSEEIISQE